MELHLLPAMLTLVVFALLAYTYAGYPALLWVLHALTHPPEARQLDPECWPHVTILLSAHNEENVITDRITNLLGVIYPRERLDILVGSDGSTDRTCELISRLTGQGVELIAFPFRRGKASVLNDLMARARGTVVVLTDANTFFHPNAVQELVRALERFPSACAAVGQLELRSCLKGGNLDGLYWRYETWIKTVESRFGSVLGANGAIYAIRRDHYEPLPPGAIVDDFLIPMLIRLRRGGAVTFVPSAQAWEHSPDRIRDEFCRRVRIGAGDLQALLWTWRLLLPWKGMIALSYFSHKVLRWLGPWLMLIGFASNLWLLEIPVFLATFVGQCLMYGLGAAATLVRQVPLLGMAASGVRYFFVLNAALLLGFVRFTLGVARPTWDTTPRRADPPDGGTKQITVAL